jgi:hypothetical protein
MKRKTKIFLPKNRIETEVRRPGGISQEQALRRANANVEGLREVSKEALEAAVNAIGAIAGGASADGVPLENLPQLMRLCNRIILLAETYGFPQLALVAMRLCDLLSKFVELRKADANAIGVYVQAMRMLSPSQPPLPRLEHERLVEQLLRVLVHYGVELNPHSKVVQ